LNILNTSPAGAILAGFAGARNIVAKSYMVKFAAV